MFRCASVLACAFVASFLLLAGAAPEIGVVLSNGSVTVDGSLVAGNATVFDGDTIQTGLAYSRVRLKNGKMIQFRSNSAARVFTDNLTLSKGIVQVAGSYEFEAKGLHIAGASMRVAIEGNTVEVAALDGPVTVLNSTGIEVGRLTAGRALAFTPQNSVTEETLMGEVRRTGDAYLLTDTTSDVTVELRGGGIGDYVQHRVRVSGTRVSAAADGGASQTLLVTNIAEQTGKEKRATAGRSPAAFWMLVGLTVTAMAFVSHKLYVLLSEKLRTI